MSIFNVSTINRYAIWFIVALSAGLGITFIIPGLPSTVNAQFLSGAWDVFLVSGGRPQ